MNRDIAKVGDQVAYLEAPGVNRSPRARARITLLEEDGTATLHLFRPGQGWDEVPQGEKIIGVPYSPKPVGGHWTEIV